MDAPVDEGSVAVLCPAQSEGTTAKVGTWFKRVGDRVAKGEPLLELETDKVALEVAAPATGRLAAIAIETGDVTPGSVLGRIVAETGKAPASPSAVAVAPADENRPKSSSPPRSIADFDPALRLSPSVRRRLAETDLDPTALEGTGRDGRLTRADVEAAVARQREPAPERSSAPERPPAARDDGTARSERVPHDAMRRGIAEHMARSVSVAPHVTAVFEVDFSAVLAHRRAHKDEFARLGVPLTLTAYAVRASVAAMRAVPAVNSRWHEDALEIFSDIHVGIGTALGETGLVVPVIRDAGTLSLLGTAQRLHDLTEKARSGRLAPADMRGGTFTLSNHGVSGSLVATPIIINQPQSAILGIGKLEKRVVVREVDGVDTIQIRPMAYVSLTIDHRALDGARTNAWLARFQAAMEKWGRDEA